MKILWLLKLKVICLKFKYGDKVIIKKSHYSDISKSIIYKKGKSQGYWYIIKYFKEMCVVNYELTNSGDFFLESDIAHYSDIMIPKLEGELFEL